MKKRIEQWLLRHWRWYRHAKLYVIADATDNSVTFSKALFRLLDVMDREVEPKVYVFHLCNAVTEAVRTPLECTETPAAEPQGTVSRSVGIGSRGWNGRIYAFCIDPPIEQETQLADIQYNAKHHCVGFECLVPTVNRIFYDYGLAAGSRAKLTVEPARAGGCCDTATNRTKDGCGGAATYGELEYYVIMPPKRNRV